MVGYKAGFEYVLDLAIDLYLLYLAMSLSHWYFLNFHMKNIFKLNVNLSVYSDATMQK